jgi:uncharacterized membrane protein AbrB (regulator of aidB expression)
MDPIIAALALVLLTATMGTLFSVAKKRGEGLAQALIGISVGWLLFLSPLYVFGPTGAIIGVVMIVLVGALMSYIGQRYGRGPAATPHRRRDD